MSFVRLAMGRGTAAWAANSVCPLFKSMISAPDADKRVVSGRNCNDSAALSAGWATARDWLPICVSAGIPHTGIMPIKSTERTGLSIAESVSETTGVRNIWKNNIEMKSMIEQYKKQKKQRKILLLLILCFLGFLCFLCFFHLYTTLPFSRRSTYCFPLPGGTDRKNKR